VGDGKEVMTESGKWKELGEKTNDQSLSSALIWANEKNQF